MKVAQGEKEETMPSYLSLLNWTDQGIRTVKDSYQRLDAAKQAARDAGGRIIYF